ncbi:MAG: hypothetical protein CFE46_14515 [Burkholderiales bacterium PBB6]|nr:MAG: hypothetical protein CFE46_14515 [Burkholderiales bacterium PBB6]
MKPTLIVALAMSSVPAWADNIVQNGSFEVFSGWDGTCPAGSTQCAQFNAGNAGLTNWTVGAGGVDVVGTPWPAAHGNYSLDLNAIAPGQISQTLSTTANQAYRLTFELGANYLYAPPYLNTKFGTVSVGSLVNQQLSFTNANLYVFPGEAAPMGWSSMVFDFVATGTSTTLIFTGLNEGNAGLALDNISVSAVPEPGSLALMTAGLAMLAGLRRRRPA